MKLVITNDFTVMMAMMGNKPFISVDIQESTTNKDTYLNASVFPTGAIYMTQINNDTDNLNLKTFLENILITSEDAKIYNVILDMHTLSSSIHQKISTMLSDEFQGIDITVFLTENEEDLNNSNFIDEYAEKIYDAFIAGLNCGATVVNLPDVDYFKEKEEMVLDEKFIPKFIPGFMACFLVLGAKDFTPQLYKMIRKEGSKVFLQYDRPFSDYIDLTELDNIVDEFDGDEDYEDDDDDGLEDLLDDLFG